MSTSLSNSEAYLLFIFEKFFLYEFYVRHLQLTQQNDYENLQQLKKEIEQKYADLNVDERLAGQYNPVSIKEVLVCCVLDALQFGEDLSYLLEERIDFSNIPKNMQENILNVGCKAINSTKFNIENSVYKFSDLAFPNNMKSVIYWWFTLLDKEIRNESKLTDNFGKIGSIFPERQANGEVVFTRYFESMPFKTPEPKCIKIKENNYEIYYSNADSVQINSEPQSDSLALIVSINKSADNLDKILEEFRSIFCLLQGDYHFNQLTSGIMPTFEPQPSKSLFSIIAERKKSNKIITKYTSVSKNLLGLYCYDLHESGKEIDVAAEEIEKLTEELHHKIDFNTIKGSYNEVRKRIES